jgi:hypothetical protein
MFLAISASLQVPGLGYYMSIIWIRRNRAWNVAHVLIILFQFCKTPVEGPYARRNRPSFISSYHPRSTNLFKQNVMGADLPR